MEKIILLSCFFCLFAVDVVVVVDVIHRHVTEAGDVCYSLPLQIHSLTSGIFTNVYFKFICNCLVTLFEVAEFDSVSGYNCTIVLAKNGMKFSET